ncbi:MAG: hypothetical protein C4567_17805 [Deltaproteobacteria bacterium]|nr:MAG: hypothetical protein C4567_17805 [Deltaproteobacteria bacterium]
MTNRKLLQAVGIVMMVISGVGILFSFGSKDQKAKEVAKQPQGQETQKLESENKSKKVIQTPRIFPPNFQNITYLAAEIDVIDYIDSNNIRKIDNRTIYIEKGGSVTYSFDVESIDRLMWWHIRPILYTEKPIEAGAKGEVVIINVNGRKHNLVLGWSPGRGQESCYSLYNGNSNAPAVLMVGKNELKIEPITQPTYIKGKIKLTFQR